MYFNNLSYSYSYVCVCVCVCVCLILQTRRVAFTPLGGARGAASNQSARRCSSPLSLSLSLSLNCWSLAEEARARRMRMMRMDAIPCRLVFLEPGSSTQKVRAALSVCVCVCVCVCGCCVCVCVCVCKCDFLSPNTKLFFTKSKTKSNCDSDL